MLKVPSLYDTVELFLINMQGMFKHARTLFSHNWKDIEKLAFMGQSAAQMRIIITSVHSARFSFITSTIKSRKSKFGFYDSDC